MFTTYYLVFRIIQTRQNQQLCRLYNIFKKSQFSKTPSSSNRNSFSCLICFILFLKPKLLANYNFILLKFVKYLFYNNLNLLLVCFLIKVFAMSNIWENANNLFNMHTIDIKMTVGKLKKHFISILDQPNVRL